LGFLQILLLELRGHPAGRRARSDVLAHLVLLSASLDTHLGCAWGLCRRRAQDQQQWWRRRKQGSW
jgi:hypothetical protein